MKQTLPTAILLLLMLRVCLQPVEAKLPDIRQIDGTFEAAVIGIDSATVTLRTNSGSRVQFSLRPGDSEGYSQAERIQLAQRFAELPGKAPTIADLHSQIRVFYLIHPGGGRYTLLKYQVLKSVSPLYLVVLASDKDIESAKHLQYKAYTQGFMSDVLTSSTFSTLRSGYQVVCAGAFTTMLEAEVCQQRARRMGYTDAYVRRLR